jgi:hypothetical protein
MIALLISFLISHSLQVLHASPKDSEVLACATIAKGIQAKLTIDEAAKAFLQVRQGPNSYHCELTIKDFSLDPNGVKPSAYLEFQKMSCAPLLPKELNSQVLPILSLNLGWGKKSLLDSGKLQWHRFSQPLECQKLSTQNSRLTSLYERWKRQ